MKKIYSLITIVGLVACTKTDLPRFTEQCKVGNGSPIPVISQLTRTENGKVYTGRYEYSKGQLTGYTTWLGYQFTVRHEPGERRFLVRGPLGSVSKDVYYYYDPHGNIVRVTTIEEGKETNTWYSYNQHHQLYEQSTGFVPGTGNTREMIKRFVYRGMWLSATLSVERTYQDNKVTGERILEVLDSISYRGPFFVRHSTSSGYRVNEYRYSPTLLDPYYYNPFTVYASLPGNYPVKAEFLFPRGFNYAYGIANFTRFNYGIGMFVMESKMVLNDYIDGKLLPYTIINKIKNLKCNNLQLPVEYDEEMTHIDNYGSVSVRTTHYVISYVNLRETF